MSEVASSPKPPQSHLPHLEGVAERVCGQIKEVNEAFALLQTTSATKELTEFFSSKLDSHVVMFDQGTEIDNRHRNLASIGIPVFSPIYLGDKVLLVVPEGTKSLANVAHLLGRNPDAHTKLFNEVGKRLRQLRDSGAGLPSTSILESFAFAADPSENNGASMYVVPPHDLDSGLNQDDLPSKLFDEFSALTSSLSHDQTEAIIEGIADGWNA